jgi:eukaryotic-like serine/threonine-protein kinase
MPLQPGVRLGSYEVLAPLGAGGMGEVYRARDTRLQREVAVKVLPELFAADPDRLARFQREAQLLASLNHPNIGSIYGFEEAEDMRALVLELVEGPTLADKLRQGAIPIDEALPIARQVADALEAAHERGIIHRDLKPANIKLRPDRTVKVLDFGLAKALESHVRTDPSASPTITSPAATQAGVVLGTAAYMAPEQAKGLDAGRTADVWAFGCVLYEMLAGRRPFDGESVSEVLAGVLKTDPDWRHLPAQTPASIRRLLRRCLEKEPRQRLQHIGDARLEIEEALASPAPDSSTPPGSFRRRERLALMSAAVVALAAGGMLGALFFRPAKPGAEVRLEIVTSPTTDVLSLAISPDGQKVVFAAASDGRPQLWLRRLDSSAARPLAGTDFGTLPFWSPDSRSIGFFADAKLKRTAIDGGSVHEVASAPGPMGGTWNGDGTILFAPFITGPIFQVSLKGGEPSALTAEGEQLGHRFPQFLPDGRHFLYYVAGTPKANGVYLGAIDRSVNTRLLEADAPAIYAASGHLMFVSQGTLLAQPFNATRLSVTGDPIRVAEEVSGDAFGAPVSASAAGPIVYRTGSLAGQRQFVWVDRAGKELQKVGELGNAIAQSPDMSDDGRRLAIQRLVNGNVDIWWTETERWDFRRATTDPENDIHARFSPDGSRIIYASRKKGVYDLYERSLEQPDSERLVFASALSKRPMDWSSDGRFLLFRHTDSNTGTDILGLPLDGSARSMPIVKTDAEDTYAQFSPDGKWIVFESNKTGRPEVFVRAFPGPGAESQVSVRGGAQARWAPNGKELFYITLDGRLMSVQLKPSPDGQAIEAAAPVPLFTTHVGGAIQRASGPQYLVAPDGKRFLMNTLAGEHPSPITVILNWKANSR